MQELINMDAGTVFEAEYNGSIKKWKAIRKGKAKKGQMLLTSNGQISKAQSNHSGFISLIIKEVHAPCPDCKHEFESIDKPVNTTPFDNNPEYLQALMDSETHWLDGICRTLDNYKDFKMKDDDCAVCLLAKKDDRFDEPYSRTCTCFLNDGNNDKSCCQEWRHCNDGREISHYDYFHSNAAKLYNRIKTERQRVEGIQQGKDKKQSKFEVGELVIRTDYDNHLCVIKKSNLSLLRDIYINKDIQNVFFEDCIKPLTIGSRFRTRCDESMFANGVGEFVVKEMGDKPKNSIEVVLNKNGIVEREHNMSNHGKIIATLLPSSDSGYWDREIGDTGIFVRIYGTRGSDFVYKFSNGKARYSSETDKILRDIISAINPPIIPHSLLELEGGTMTAPEAPNGTH